ncbi:MAG: hypothetical protein LBB25_01235 [Holosporaceae bacterium]|jgi:hypothetical protein|nr:hypothetical protein [Holosporaceae bacterium]
MKTKADNPIYLTACIMLASIMGISALHATNNGSGNVQNVRQILKNLQNQCESFTLYTDGTAVQNYLHSATPEQQSTYNTTNPYLVRRFGNGVIMDIEYDAYYVKFSAGRWTWYEANSNWDDEISEDSVRIKNEEFFLCKKNPEDTNGTACRCQRIPMDNDNDNDPTDGDFVDLSTTRQILKNDRMYSIRYSYDKKCWIWQKSIPVNKLPARIRVRVDGSLASDYDRPSPVDMPRLHLIPAGH